GSGSRSGSPTRSAWSMAKWMARSSWDFGLDMMDPAGILMRRVARFHRADEREAGRTGQRHPTAGAAGVRRFVSPRPTGTAIQPVAQASAGAGDLRTLSRLRAGLGRSRRTFWGSV